MSRPSELRITEVVTREHGEKFADVWRDRTIDSGAMSEAFLETRIVIWPDNRLAHMRFHDIEEELRSQYSLAYRPADFKLDGAFRSIYLVALNPHYVVRAKKGYFAPPKS